MATSFTNAAVERFSPAQFIEAFDATIALKGLDYVYPETEKYGGSCRYAVSEDHNDYGIPVMGDTPSCVVGHVVFRLAGVAGLHQLTEGAGAVVTLVPLMGNAASAEGKAARIAAGAAQQLQDSGWPWGVAQKAFHHVYENMLIDDQFGSDWYANTDSILLPHTWAAELKLEHLIPAAAVAQKQAVEDHQHTV